MRCPTASGRAAQTLTPTGCLHVRHGLHEVGFGENPGQDTLLDDRQTSALIVEHDLRGRGRVLVRVYRLDLPSHDVCDCVRSWKKAPCGEISKAIKVGRFAVKTDERAR